MRRCCGVRGGTGGLSPVRLSAFTTMTGCSEKAIFLIFSRSPKIRKPALIAWWNGNLVHPRNTAAWRRELPILSRDQKWLRRSPPATSGEEQRSTQNKDDPSGRFLFLREQTFRAGRPRGDGQDP